MANPLELITKTVQFGARTTFGVVRGAIGAIEGLTGGGGAEEPTAEPPARDEQNQPARATKRGARTQRRRSSTQPKPVGDVAITRKVETVIFRDPEVPKGKIDVNTADGVVWLRGEAKTPEMIKALEAQARGIPEVKRVENLLHLPKTPAPTRTDSPPAQRKTRRSSPATQARERPVTPTQTTSERRFTNAEPAPDELAATRQGRQPAPLGSEGPGGGEPGGDAGGD